LVKSLEGELDRCFGDDIVQRRRIEIGSLSSTLAQAR
jgi:hypothetical protein